MADPIGKKNIDFALILEQDAMSEVVGSPRDTFAQQLDMTDYPPLSTVVT